MSGKLLQIFPLEKRSFWQQVAAQEKEVQEIRLRAGLPILVVRRGREWYLDKEGYFTDKPEEACRAEAGELDNLLQHICHYSLYAFEDELKQGFITVAGGHRVGIAGQVVLETDKNIRTIKHISYVNIRISHEIKGVADKLLPLAYERGIPKNILIISPPGCGKTTLLRDLIRQISDGNACGKGLSVGVVDERSEIAGSFMGRPQNDVGLRTDVLDACPKGLGMMMLLRSMAPKVIAVDELGGRGDMEALHMAASCGCRILATVHGEDLWDIQRKQGFREIFEERLFDCFPVLGKEGGSCVIKRVYGREEAYAEDSGSRDDHVGVPGTGVMVPPAVYMQAEDSAGAGGDSGAFHE